MDVNFMRPFRVCRAVLPQIGGEPVLSKAFGEPNRHQAGVVDHYVDSTGRGVHLIYCTLDRIWISNVHFQRSQCKIILFRQALKGVRGARVAVFTSRIVA